MRWRVAQWLETWWWMNYLREKPVEDYARWKRDYWLAFLARTGVSPGPAARLLDAGCGPAGIFISLPEHRVTAIDPLLDKYTRLDHFNPQLYPNVVFRRETLEQMDFNREFDVVFCINAINHVRDIGLSVQNLARACKPGGTIVMSIDTHRYLAVKWLFRVMPFLDILHPHQHTLGEYRTLLQQQHVQVTGCFRISRSVLFNYDTIVGKKL